MGPANLLLDALPAAGLWLFTRPSRRSWSEAEAGSWLWLLLGVDVLGTVEAASDGFALAAWVTDDAALRLCQMASTREPVATPATCAQSGGTRVSVLAADWQTRQWQAMLESEHVGTGMQRIHHDDHGEPHASGQEDWGWSHAGGGGVLSRTSHSALHPCWY